jgi:hypothetical protein
MLKHLLAGPPGNGGKAFWLSFVLAIALATGVLAQSNATLTGTVTDPSGGVVTGAEVKTVNTQTGVNYHTITNNEGLFRFPNLPIGSYEVTVVQPGFERLERSGLQLLTGQTVDLALVLGVGQPTESVKVEAAAPIVQTTDSELQTSFNSRNVRELPLNGRNPLQLVVLTPGAQLSAIGTQGNQQENTGVSVNGLRTIDNNYELDGSLYLNRQFNSAPILPNPDALEEFTVKASNFSASEVGAGAMVQLSTRSGSNNFHGSAFEFLRNDDLDARNFFAKQVTPFKRNQFGGTIGGPIKTDRTFFFGSYQGTRVSGGANPTQATVPTAAMRAGDFSGISKIIIDPTTGKQFPGNVIPESRFADLSVKLLPYVPLPNVTGLQYTATPNSDVNDDQFIVRIDHVLTERDHLTGRYSFDEYDYNRLTSAFDNIYARNFFRAQNLVVSETHSFNSGLIYVGSFGYTRDGRTQIPTEPVTVQELGQNAPFAITDAAPELRVNVGGYYNLFSGGGLGATSSIYLFRNRFTWNLGKHLLQFGLDIERDTMYSYDTSFSSGTSTFNGSRTGLATVSNSGDAFADFLLGLPNDFNQAGRGPQDFYETKWQPFIQDDWRISPRLTLNLGLRWDPWLPAYNTLGPGAAFVAGVQSTVAPLAPTGLLFTGDPGLRNSIYPTDWNNFAPRAGFAWDVTGNGKDVLRGAYGLFYRTIPLNIYRASYSGSAFTSLTIDITNPSSFADPFSGYAPGNPFPFTAPAASALSTYKFVSPVVTSVLDPNSQTGTTQQWNITYERQLRENLGLSVAYVGNKSNDIMATYQANPAVYGPGATVGNTQSRRVYPAFGALAVASPWGDQNYNGLQVQVTRRAGRGLSLLANYTFSKCFDNTTSQVLGADAGGGSQIHKYTPFNPAADYAVCDFNVTHLGNVSAVYDLPRVASLHGFTGFLVNGWNLSGIFTIRSGLPFSVYSGRDNSLTGSPNNDLADQLVADVSRADGADPIRQWFNPKAYKFNAIGTFGSSGRNGIYGPGYWNLDTALTKQTPITEHVALQLRFEAFNVFNHPNFNNPVATVSAVNFAQITSSTDPRVLQIGAKLLF